jgi:hypothetical protein
MKLKNLKGFEIMNAQVLDQVIGGVKEDDSKKKDVSSDEKDCISRDTFES